MSKIAILTNFNDFNFGYSLTGIVLDQIRMLQEHGHEVVLYVSDHFTDSKDKEYNFEIKEVVPVTSLIDYQHHGDLSVLHIDMIDSLSQYFTKDLENYDYIFTHDWIFTGWNLPYAMAIIKASPSLMHVKNWYHWVHSVPSGLRSWWNLSLYGKKHKIVFPNKFDRVRVAEQFRTLPHNVLSIPHPKDLRTWFDFDDRTCKIIKEYPSIMQSDIVQVYPASSDRLDSKGVEDLIYIFGNLKRRGKSVCLFIANQWATGRQPKQSIQKFKDLAVSQNLTLDSDFIFSSEIGKEYENGLPRRILRELFHCSNLFIFPTRGESFGLVSLEAGLSSSVLPVLNSSLLMQPEIHKFTGLYFEFGSYYNTFRPKDKEKYFYDLTTLILDKLHNEEAIKFHTVIRQNYNYDYIYHRYYEPLLIKK